jgi:hypothetical protein
MRRKLVPTPPKFLIVFLGVVSFFSFIGVLLGTYGLISVESGNTLYKVKCSFKEDDKLKASGLFDELKSRDFDPELIDTTVYITEDRGFIVCISFEGKDKELLANKIKALVEGDGLKATIFTTKLSPGFIKLQVGDVLATEAEAQAYYKKVFAKTQVTFEVEPYKVVTGEQKVFIVALKTKDPFIAEDYKKMLKDKGYSPEVTEEKIQKPQL